MTGYTRLSSQLPFEEVNAIIERYFGAFLDEILRHGGDVNETAGDGLMVLFQDDDPKAHAQAAVRAALEIQRLTREINAERVGQAAVGMHIGVNSGTASVGATKISGAAGGNRWTYTASGPTTNIAARVGALGEEIAITEATRCRLGPDFQVEPLGLQALKNVKEPVAAFRVVGAALARSAAPAPTIPRADEVVIGSSVTPASPPAAPATARKGWFRVSGVLREQETNRVLPGLRVSASDRDLLVDDYLGETTSDEAGRFEIRFTEDLFPGLVRAAPGPLPANPRRLGAARDLLDR